MHVRRLLLLVFFFFAIFAHDLQNTLHGRCIRLLQLFLTCAYIYVPLPTCYSVTYLVRLPASQHSILVRASFSSLISCTWSLWASGTPNFVIAVDAFDRALSKWRHLLIVLRAILGPALVIPSSGPRRKSVLPPRDSVPSSTLRPPLKPQLCQL